MTRSAFGRKLAFGAVLLATASAQLFVVRPEVFAQAPAATIRTFEDKAAFLAATAANSATGPLPDLGEIPFGSPVPLGALTVTGLVDGTLYVGAQGTDAAPDWYPARPGNEIAFSTREVFQVESAIDLHALGFELAEPNASPVDSVYTVRLYVDDPDPTLVGEFVFNAPDDQVAFVGVWSDQAFTRAEIADTSIGGGDDDAEHFGEFYTGTLAAPPALLPRSPAAARPCLAATASSRRFPRARR